MRPSCWDRNTKKGSLVKVVVSILLPLLIVLCILDFIFLLDLLVNSWILLSVWELFRLVKSQMKHDAPNEPNQAKRRSGSSYGTDRTLLLQEDQVVLIIAEVWKDLSKT
jgi:hypothetical protein